MKIGSLLAALALPLTAYGGVSPITHGDAAFISYNADEDGFALVAFVDLVAGSTFHVTDNEWDAGGTGFTTGEGDLAWTLDTDLAAGTVVRFSDVNSKSRVAVSHGALSMSDRLRLSARNESLYLYLDTPRAPFALAAFGMGKNFPAELTGSGLEASAVALPGRRADFAQYMGARSGKQDFGDYRADISDPANWLVRSGSDESATLPDMTAFTVSAAAVPEPATAALMLAGMGAMSLSRRRRG